ncbi:UNVERIFIED_CONTAM: hypothetical protein HDU68_011645 [Siphonaria sp. JEL0065]|nr:hypothetical protein HDU68_011645 [Siphonaria sp. JEL0065]
MSTTAAQEVVTKFSLPTKPSRLVRVPSPPESQTAQPVVYHPYPHSTKRSNSANTERPSICQQHEQLVQHDSQEHQQLHNITPKPHPPNPLINTKRALKSVVTISSSPLTTPTTTTRPPLQPPPHTQTLKNQRSQMHTYSESKTTISLKASLVQRAVLKPQDSKISLSGKGVANGRRTIAEQRVSSISTLQEEEAIEEEEADSDVGGDGMGDSVVGGTEEEDYEESELENDDEEEQEISDFDSSGEYDEDEEEEDDMEEDDRITTGCTRSTSLSDSEDPGIRNWKSSSRGNKKGSRNDHYSKKCDSAKRYGIAVLIDDPMYLSNQNGYASSGSAGGSHAGGGDFFDSSSTSGLKLKPSIVPSLFDDGDAVLYFPKEGEAGENSNG